VSVRYPERRMLCYEQDGHGRGVVVHLECHHDVEMERAPAAGEVVYVVCYRCEPERAMKAGGANA
jgi:hypothetical protein